MFDCVSTSNHSNFVLKIVISPKEINTRSLQVEMLEREITELKTSLTEANSKNSTLTQLLETQKMYVNVI